MIEKQVAVVTGSSKGIGFGIALELAKKGFNIVLNGRSDINELKQQICDVEKEGAEVSYFRGDISDGNDRQELLHFTIEKFGRVDVLVNNAGVAPNERLDLLEVTEESLNRLLQINLVGTFFLSQSFAKCMISLRKSSIENYKPRIINISSISANTVSLNRGEYCISKAGISMTTQLFAVRLAEEGICVFEVRPGIIATDMTKNVTQKYDELIENGLVPAKRWGHPQDIADAVAALCSGKLDFAIGQVINCDGGLNIRRL